ncbi:MAG: hypothetical protein R3B70_02975 [Polyangiaceae bacterium]
MWRSLAAFEGERGDDGDLVFGEGGEEAVLGEDGLGRVAAGR